MKTTSIEARINKIKSGTIMTDQAQIYNLFELFPYRDFTYCEISQSLKWQNPNKASRRLKEMVDLGLIEENEIRMCKVADSRCTAYRLRK